MGSKRPTRRWFRYSLRSLTLMIALACIVGGWWVNKVHRRQQAVEAIEALYGGVYFEYQWEAESWSYDTEVDPPGPVWVRRYLGEYAFVTPEKVSYCYWWGHGWTTSTAVDEDLRHLRALPQTKKLELNGAKITSAGLDYLAGLHDLEECSLPFTHVGDEGLAHLAELRKLEVLDLRGTEVTDAGLVHLSKLTQLTELRLGGTQVTGEGIEQLSTLQSLRYLDLRDTPVMDEGLQWIAKLHGLEELWLTNAPITDAGLAQLSELPRLREIYLAGTNVGGSGFAAWPDDTLEVIDLRCAAVTDADLDAMQHFANLSRREFDGNWGLSRNDPADLRYYSSSSVENGFEGIAPDRVLERLAAAENLKSLNISGSDIGDGDLVYLENLGQLEILWLRGTSITGEGLQSIESLQGLWRVCVMNSPLGDEGLVFLGRLINLRELNLTGTELTDEGLAHLTSLEQLESLNLYETCVTSAGMLALAELPSLKELTLSYTLVDDTGLEALAACTQLRKLDLTETEITEAGAAGLREALPDCEISHSDANAPQPENWGGAF